MKVAERTVDGVTILDVDGNLTLGDGADLLRDKVRSHLQQDHKRILINLAGVGYMDSAGLGELVHTYATTCKQGGTMKLLNTTKRLHDLLVITKLANVFDCFDEERAAVASFGSTS